MEARVDAGAVARDIGSLAGALFSHSGFVKSEADFVVYELEEKHTRGIQDLEKAAAQISDIVIDCEKTEESLVLISEISETLAGIEERMCAFCDDFGPRVEAASVTSAEDVNAAM